MSEKTFFRILYTSLIIYVLFLLGVLYLVNSQVTHVIEVNSCKCVDNGY